MRSNYTNENNHPTGAGNCRLFEPLVGMPHEYIVDLLEVLRPHMVLKDDLLHTVRRRLQCQLGVGGSSISRPIFGIYIIIQPNQSPTFKTSLNHPRSIISHALPTLHFPIRSTLAVALAQNDTASQY